MNVKCFIHNAAKTYSKEKKKIERITYHDCRSCILSHTIRSISDSNYVLDCGCDSFLRENKGIHLALNKEERCSYLSDKLLSFIQSNLRIAKI